MVGHAVEVRISEESISAVTVVTVVHLVGSCALVDVIALRRLTIKEGDFVDELGRSENDA